MHFRLTQPEDLPIARAFVPPAYRYSPAVHAALPDIWRALLQSGQLTSAVLESGNNGSARVLGVGLSVFVSDAFAEACLAHPVPYLNNRLHEMILAGSSPLLDAKAIAAANQGDGLNLLPLHFCTASVDIEDPAVLPVLSAAQDLFRLMHAGFRVKRVIKEVVNLNLCRFMQSTGMKLACDYARDLPAPELAALPDTERPYLLSVQREDMPLGSPLSLMFLPAPARFRFSRAERKLLMCALLRDSDEELARDLGLSQDTLRKHWKSIFQRVIAVDPWFFPLDDGDKLDGGQRGRGKRRHLLRHLHQHMQELRPQASPTGKA